MLSMLRDRDEFVIGAAILGTALAVLNLAYAQEWGWIPALVVLPAMAARAWWRTMPAWLLLTWTLVPTLVGQAADRTVSDYMVVIVAIVVVAAHRPGRLDQALIGLCVLSPFGLWALGTSEWHEGIGSWIWAGGLVIGWAYGTSIGQQWDLIDELERTRTKLAEAAVADERRRIARELHDVVGHSFSVVLLHLSGARMILDSAPEEASAALRDAEDVGRRGMDELHQALLLLRDGTETLAPAEASDLDRLVGRYRAAGMRVDLAIDGDLPALPAGPSLVLHDVVREALTNVAKHGAEKAATIRITIDGDVVDVQVENGLPAEPPGSPGPAPTGAGLGLAGLEHRIAAVGGTFDAGRCGDRWVVVARLPDTLAGAPT